MPRTRDPGTSERVTAYDALRTELILGRRACGERLREADLTRRLGVNRSAVREALARLQSEGLVVEGEKCGYRVPVYTPRDLQEMGEVCRTIEAGAVEVIIQRGLGRDEFRQLQELCDELEFILAKGYSVDLREIDQRFHEALVTLSGSGRLLLLRRCVPQAAVTGATCNEADRNVAACWMLQEHRAILAAIAEGKLESALNLVGRHYRAQAPVSRAACGVTQAVAAD
jgi:DNA-binding GntR family transcriptional regulator